MSKHRLVLAGIVLFLVSVVSIVALRLSPGVAAQGVNPNPGRTTTGGATAGGGIGRNANVKFEEVKEGLLTNLTTGSQSQENSEVNSVQNIQVGLIGGLIGGLPSEDASGKIVYNTGLIGTASDLVVAMYNNPAADTQAYIADLLNSAGLVQPAYAQGLGFSALDPVLEVWKIFRNIAYFFFVVAFMVIGFMIMFRQKISSQTVVTAQQAIPSIIVALLAVTFSYAIAGLLIDLMYIIMYLMVGLFGRNSATMIDGNFIQLGFKIVGGSTNEVGEMVSSFINDTLGGGVLGGLAGIAGGVTAMLIFAVAIAIGVFRLFFNLLRRYVAVVLSVALAPLLLMVGAIPGKSTFGSWIKGIVGNLAAFPILLIALIIVDVMTGTLSGAGAAVEYGGFLPPYLGGSGTPGTLAFIVGLGILLILSELVDKGAELFGAGKGPLDSLVEAMGKNFMQGTVGLPVIGAAGGGAIGGGVAAYDYLKNSSRGDRSWRDAYKAIVKGEGSGIRKGAGAATGGLRGFGVGQTVRKYIERGQEGRLFQVENVETMLADRVAKAQRDALKGGDEDKDKGKGQSAPAKSQV